jgi:hypothetical protein
VPIVGAESPDAGKALHRELRDAVSGLGFGERMALFRALMGRWEDLSGSKQRLFADVEGKVKNGTR